MNGALHSADRMQQLVVDMITVIDKLVLIAGMLRLSRGGRDVPADASSSNMEGLDRPNSRLHVLSARSRHGVSMHFNRLISQCKGVGAQRRNIRERSSCATMHLSLLICSDATFAT